MPSPAQAFCLKHNISIYKKIVSSTVLILVAMFLLSACGNSNNNNNTANKNISNKNKAEISCMSNNKICATSYAWQDRPKLDLRKHIYKIRLKTVSGERVKDQKHIVKKSTFSNEAFYLIRDLYPKNSRKRFSFLTICRHNYEKNNVRIIDIYGDLQTLKSDKSGKRFIKQTLQTACSASPGKAIKKQQRKLEKQKRAQTAQAITTKLGKGVKTSKIKSVLIRQEDGLGSGGLMYIDYDVLVLFKDKWAYINPPALGRFDMKKSKQLQAERWYRWKSKGKNLKIRKNGEKKWRSVKDYNIKVKPLKKGAKTSGNLSYIEAGGSIWYGSTISRGYYNFKRDGTYSSGSSTQFGGGMAMNELGGVNVYSHCNEKGGGSIASGTEPLTDGAGNVTSSGTPSVVISSKKKYKQGCGDGKAGRYKIDGYTLTLFANNGKTASLPIYKLGKKWYLINGQSYSERNKK